MSGVLAFDGSSVAFGGGPDGSRTWLSLDGRTWSASTLSSMVKACPVSDSEADAYPEAGATDGHTIVLVGIEYRLGVTPCGSMRAVSWASSDGHTWLRSTGWGDAGASAAFSDAKSVWAVPGGWEAIVWTGSDKPTTLWRSPDGTTWQESTDVVIRQPGGSLVPNTGLAAYAGAADAGGTRLLALSNDQDAAIAGIPGGIGALMTSTDGKIWQEVDATFTAGRAGGGIGPIVPPSAGASSWLLVTQIPEHNPVIWTTRDLRHWTKKTFAMPALAGLGLTRYGYVATGHDPCGMTGGGCPPPKPTTQYVSANGLTWTRFASSVSARYIVDGPAGVLAVNDENGRVWRLRR